MILIVVEETDSTAKFWTVLEGTVVWRKKNRKKNSSKDEHKKTTTAVSLFSLLGVTSSFKKKDKWKSDGFKGRSGQKMFLYKYHQ